MVAVAESFVLAVVVDACMPAEPLPGESIIPFTFKSNCLISLNGSAFILKNTKSQGFHLEENKMQSAILFLMQHLANKY
jgi:hypothetical protein